MRNELRTALRNGSRATLSAALLALVGCATPVVQQDDLTADALRITDYPYNADIHGNDLPVEIARFDAPLIHGQNGDSRSIELGFLRYPADAAVEGPPIVLLRDESVGQAVSQELVLSLRKIGDVVVFDRRGQGFSSPVLPCPNRLGYPFDQPLSQGRLTRLTCGFAMTCLEALSERGYAAPMYSQAAFVADLELLGQVLEAERMHLLAIGDTGQAVMALMDRAPQRVDNAVLITTTRESQTDPSVPATTILDALGRHLEQEPIKATDENRSGQSVAITIGQLDLAFLRANPYVAKGTKEQDLAGAAAAAANDEFGPLAGLVLQMRQGLGQIDSLRLLNSAAADTGTCPADSAAEAQSAHTYARTWPGNVLDRPTAGADSENAAAPALSRRRPGRVLILQTAAGRGGEPLLSPDQQESIFQFLAESEGRDR